MLPTRIVPVGDTIVVGGVLMRAIVRPKMAAPSMVCSGCAMRSRFCDNYACSKSDRNDGMNVWFVEEGSCSQDDVLMRLTTDGESGYSMDMSDDADAVADALLDVALDNDAVRSLILGVAEDILASMPADDAGEWLSSMSETIGD